jgi:60S ribosome subunit biogenesis protein NIP7
MSASPPGGAYLFMRPLSEEETTIFFTKLAKYIGKNIKHLIERPDGVYVFRFHKDRVYYMSETLLKVAQGVSFEELLAAGTCFGKFTKTKKFRLHVTALDYIAKFAEFKVWIKPSTEMSYLYGNHVVKAGLGRITANTAKYQGAVVLSMGNVPLGFATTAHSTQDCRKVDPTTIIAFNQTDIGEYLRAEDTLV